MTNEIRTWEIIGCQDESHSIYSRSLVESITERERTMPGEKQHHHHQQSPYDYSVKRLLSQETSSPSKGESDLKGLAHENEIHLCSEEQSSVLLCPPPKNRARRARTYFDDRSIQILEHAFLQEQYPDIHRREQLSHEIGTSEARVQVDLHSPFTFAGDRSLNFFLGLVSKQAFALSKTSNKIQCQRKRDWKRWNQFEIELRSILRRTLHSYTYAYPATLEPSSIHSHACSISPRHTFSVFSSAFLLNHLLLSVSVFVV